MLSSNLLIVVSHEKREGCEDLPRLVGSDKGRSENAFRVSVGI